MAFWRRFFVAATGTLALLGAGAAPASADENGTVISFQSMTPISGAAVNAFNDRGLKSGGIAWSIASGTGSVDRSGHVTASVRGLVLAGGPPAIFGTNPIHTFAAVVSCRTTGQDIVNVQTAGVPATNTGNATIDTTVALPHPCTTPEVLVGGLITTPAGTIFRFFATSNGDFADAS